MTTGELLLVALVMLAGVLGILIPVMPGLLLVLAGGLWWALADGGGSGRWAVFAVMAAIMLVASIVKWFMPVRSSAQAGATRTSLALAVLAGIAGFFIIPVLGAPIGFVLGIYLAERLRLGAHDQARRSTVAALKGVGLAFLLEFTAAMLMIGVWAIAEIVAL